MKIKAKRNRKWKIPHTIFREANLMLQLISESQIKSKAGMSWSSRKKKVGIFCAVYFAWREFCKDLCFISVYSVLKNTLSEYTYFYISENITYTLLLFVFKIVKSLQFILKSRDENCIYWVTVFIIEKGKRVGLSAPSVNLAFSSTLYFF